MYLSLDKNQLKLLYLKKTLLSQYESAYYEKSHQVELLTNGKIASTDLLASAIKEAVTTISATPIKEKEVYLILPQESFLFMRTEVPKDLAPSAIDSFIKDKARAAFPGDIDNTFSDYILTSNDKEQQVIFYAINAELFKKHMEVFNLINLQIVSIIPETLAYYKLFEKTLRKEKKEYILYVTLGQKHISGYLYDSFGPMDQAKAIDEPLTDAHSVETILKQKADMYEQQGKKMNRIILSGENSEHVRQDTFTKNVGVWTNPLKRIIPDFYQDYLKLLISDPNKPLPFLQYDVCIGGFIFSIENKKFSFFKKGLSKINKPSFTAAPIKLPLKEIFIFVGSFFLSFLVWMFVSRIDIGIFKKAPEQPIVATSPTPTKAPPTPTASPTPAVDKKDIRIRVLNGSGIAGKAADVKTVLTDKGYTQILTGNADEFDFTTTEIQIKKDATASAAVIKADLKDNVSAPKVTTLDEKDTADVVIIVGTDFK